MKTRGEPVEPARQRRARRSARRRRFALTPSGRALAPALCVALPCGWLLGGAFAVLAATLAGALLLGLVTARRRVEAVAVGRLPSGRAPVGDTWLLPLELTHRGGPRVRDLVLRIAGPGGSRRVAGHLPMLAPMGRTRVLLCRRVLRRGPVHALDLELATSFPLGLVEARRTVRLDVDLLGLPRIGRFAARRYRRGGRAQELLRARVAGRAQHTEPAGVRAHRPGEPARRIHWRASARREDLVLRSFAAEQAPPLRLVLSCRPDALGPFADGGASFEVAVALVATLASADLRAGRSVGLSTVGDARMDGPTARLEGPRRTGRGGLATLLATLATTEGVRAGPDPGPHRAALRDAAAAGRRRGEEPLVVLAGGTRLEGELPRLERELGAAVIDADDPEVLRCLRGDRRHAGAARPPRERSDPARGAPRARAPEEERASTRSRPGPTRTPHASGLRGPRVAVGLVAACALLGLDLGQGLLRSGFRLPPGVAALAVSGAALAAGTLAFRAATRVRLAAAAATGVFVLAQLDPAPVGAALVAALAFVSLVGARLPVEADPDGADVASALAPLRLALAGAALALLLGPAAVPGWPWLLLLPLGIGLALVAAARLQLASGRSDALASAPAALRARLTAPAEPAARAGVLRDLVPVAAGLACGGPLLALVLETLPRPDLGPTPLEGFPDAPRTAARPEAAPDGAAEAQFDGRFPDGVPLGSAPSTLRHEEVLRVRPRVGGGTDAPRPLGPLYLRGTALEHLDAGGLRAARPPGPRRCADADDGRADGWTTLRGGWTAGDLVLEVEQAPVYLQGSAWSLLFAPAGVRAIDRSPIEWEPDQLLATPDVPAAEGASSTPLAPHRYRLRSVERRGERLDLSSARVDRSVPSRLTRLPRGRHATRLRTLARSLADADAPPEARIRAVLAHFEDGFLYDLRAGHPPGLEGILRFLAERRGFCTSYAAAAVALLRALDVPARVATGFCASDWDPEAEAYVVTTANGHAWIEVPYEGLGWVVFDPTPAAVRLSELASAGRAPGAGLADWWAEVRHDLGRWRTARDEASWEELVATVRLLPSALGATGWPFLGTAAGLAGLLWLARRARKGPGIGAAGAERRPSAPQRSDPLEHRLVRALGRRGHRRRPGDALLGWCRRVAGADPEVGDAPQLAGWLQRARFGAVPLRPTEHQRTEGWLRRWEAPPPPDPAAGADPPGPGGVVGG